MPTSYALLSASPPTQCGLATFTAALLTHLGQPGDQVAVVRVLDEPAPPSPAEPGEVVHDLVAGSAASASAAAEVLNGFDVVIVQHEYALLQALTARTSFRCLKPCRYRHRGSAHGPGPPDATAAHDPR